MTRRSQSDGNSASRLLTLIKLFARQRITVLGDLVADEFVSGEISRVSRDAPVLILRRRHSEIRPGGGANAVNNLIDLGAKVFAVGVLGNDDPGRALLTIFKEKGVDCSGIVRPPGFATPTKTRFLAGWLHTSSHQVLRVDRESEAGLSPAVRRKLVVAAQVRSRRAGAVLVSDYGLGNITPDLVRAVTSPIVTLDSRYSMLSFTGSGITAATPNEPELEAIYHMQIGNSSEELDRCAEKARNDMRMAGLLVTRGKHGAVLYERDRAPFVISPFGEENAADVTGAGDTVIAVFTLALAAGGTMREAARLANYAGGIVVMKRGTATLTRRELENAVRSDEKNRR